MKTDSDSEDLYIAGLSKGLRAIVSLGKALKFIASLVKHGVQPRDVFKELSMHAEWAGMFDLDEVEAVCTDPEMNPWLNNES